MKISENITYVTDKEAELIQDSRLEKQTARRINQRTLELAGIGHKTRRLRIAWVCAAVIAVLTCSVFAAETTGLDYRLAGLFENGSSADMGEAVQSLDETTEKNGVKITALQAMGDKHCAYVLYRIDLAEEIGAEIKDLNDVCFDMVYVSKEKPASGGWYTNYICEDGVLYAAVSMDFRTAKTNRGSYDVSFKDLRTYSGDILVAGEWELPLELDYTPVSRKVSSGQIIRIGEGKCRLKGIEISPISVRAEFTRGSNVIMEDIKIDAVTLKSGENLAKTQVSSGSSSGMFGRVCSLQFDKIVDIDDIESVTINGQKIML